MSWARIEGHDRQVDTFRRAVRTNRLGHAYLFTGPDGVGKKLFATELAKALLCESPPAGQLEACDRCASCALVAAETHPDFLVTGRLPESLELSIKVIRELCENLSLKPARGHRRVAIVDDADDFNEESANSFLKVLEEPPPGSILILIGIDPARQLPTIRSRCQHIAFDPLSDETVALILQREGTIDAVQVRRLTRIAEGSPGLARQLAAPEFAEFRQAWLDELSKPVSDSPTLAKRWMDLIVAAGKDSAAQRRRASTTLHIVLDILRLALYEDRASMADPEEVAQIQAIADRFGEEGLLDRVDRCLAAETHIDRRVQLILLIEALVDALTQPEGIVTFQPAWTL